MSPSPPCRIAMWSGPRNISTALMRAWGNRPDTFVVDEPLYAHYLLMTGREHPGRDEIIAHYETDWRKVVAWLTGDVPQDKPVFYQKHMTHHWLPHFEADWLEKLANCFLIREPREVVTSYLNIEGSPEPDLADLGYRQQVEIFETVRRQTGRVPPVLDARDVLENPRRLLGLLCDAVGVPFSEAMLSWPAGRRETDGIWAKHWYASVEKSTTFQPYRPKPDQVPERLIPLYEQCLELYHRLYEHRLT